MYIFYRICIRICPLKNMLFEYPTEYPTEYPSVKKHLFHTLLREASSLRILPKLPSINNKKDPVSGVFFLFPILLSIPPQYRLKPRYSSLSRPIFPHKYNQSNIFPSFLYLLLTFSLIFDEK